MLDALGTALREETPWSSFGTLLELVAIAHLDERRVEADGLDPITRERPTAPSSHQESRAASRWRLFPEREEFGNNGVGIR